MHPKGPIFFSFREGKGGGSWDFWKFVFPFYSICFHQSHKGIHYVLPLFIKFSISFQCVYDSTILYSISFAQMFYSYLTYIK
jgi:hypothetical protein